MKQIRVIKGSVYALFGKLRMLVPAGTVLKEEQLTSKALAGYLAAGSVGYVGGTIEAPKTARAKARGKWREDPAVLAKMDLEQLQLRAFEIDPDAPWSDLDDINLRKFLSDDFIPAEPVAKLEIVDTSDPAGLAGKSDAVAKAKRLAKGK
jgi:hypothetical protein